MREGITQKPNAKEGEGNGNTVKRHEVNPLQDQGDVRSPWGPAPPLGKTQEPCARSKFGDNYGDTDRLNFLTRQAKEESQESTGATS